MIKFISEIHKTGKPYKVKCIEFGNMSTKFRLRIGFILTNKKLKWFNFKHLKSYLRSYQFSIKCFSIALLIKKQAGKP